MHTRKHKYPISSSDMFEAVNSITFKKNCIDNCALININLNLAFLRQLNLLIM